MTRCRDDRVFGQVGGDRIIILIIIRTVYDDRACPVVPTWRAPDLC